jgi:hypothetical protein
VAVVNRSVVRWRARTTMEKRAAAMLARVLRFGETERRRRREWMGEVWTVAGTPFYTLSSWPRCQVVHGTWRTRGGDGLKLSATQRSECLNRGRQW